MVGNLYKSNEALLALIAAKLALNPSVKLALLRQEDQPIRPALKTLLSRITLSSLEAQETWLTDILYVVVTDSRQSVEVEQQICSINNAKDLKECGKKGVALKLPQGMVRDFFKAIPRVQSKRLTGFSNYIQLDPTEKTKWESELLTNWNELHLEVCKYPLMDEGVMLSWILKLIRQVCSRFSSVWFV